MLSLRSLRPAFLVLLAPLALPAGAGAQEADHLACVAVKDSPQADGPVPVTISDILEDSFGDCVVKKTKMTSLCIPVARDGGNDPRGGLSGADAYACYKIKCGTGKPDGSVSATDQFGGRLVERKKLLTLCAPVDLP